MLVSLFSSNIPLYIQKNSVEKLCKVLEMELKTYNSVSPKFVFEKIKFKVLHYIQHGFIRQRLGLSKYQASMFKSFVINLIADYEILLRIHSNGYIKGDKYFSFIKRRQMFLFYKSRCCKCSLEIKLLIN